MATSSLSYSRIQAQAGTPAGFWVRFVAWLIDLVILLVLDGIIGFIFGAQSVSDTFFEDDFGGAGMIGFLVNAVYYTVGVAVWSTTIGKRALGLYVLRPDGSKVGPGRALARWVAHGLSFITFGIGFIMIGVREDKRGLHDLICDTVVVKW